MGSLDDSQSIVRAWPMRVAVMQPYLLPYIGYFQLLAAVDRFVVLDRVNYITRGWINRNRILLRGEPHLFTLPLRHASQHRAIRDIELAPDVRWRSKFFRTLELAYARAPHYAATMALLEAVFDTRERNLSRFVTRSLQLVNERLGIGAEMMAQGEADASVATGPELICRICEQSGADTYVNLPGGRALYDAAFFAARGIRLSFLEPAISEYSQFDQRFVGALSIIDVLMFNDVATVKGWLAVKRS